MSQSSPVEQLKRLLKCRASLTGEDSFFWWKGYLYGDIPGQRGQRLLAIEGYNVARVEPCEGGYYMITREVNLYRDLHTGEVLEQWLNPMNGRTVDVIQVWNDPVNQQFLEHGARGPFAVPTEDLGNGMACMYIDVLLAYPSPLPRSEYPLNSQDDLYQGAELFQFFVDKKQLDDPTTVDINCSTSWTRIGPWLPWMEMGDQPGHLIYQCRGAKLMGGFSDLPEYMQQYVLKHFPSYTHSPEIYTEDNETSWTYFKKLKGAQR